MLSFGPQIEFPHSPDERVSIPTVERFWKLLVGVVDELSQPGGARDEALRLAVLAAARPPARLGRGRATGATTPARRSAAGAWADDVCGAVGAWEGQLEAIGDELDAQQRRRAAHDGGSGDAVEGTVYVRDGRRSRASRRPTTRCRRA